MKKQIGIIGLIIVLLMSIAGCGKATKTDGLDKDYYQKGAQQVRLDVEYKANFLMATESMDIYIDNHKFYTVNCGDSCNNEYSLTKGDHVLKVASSTTHYASQQFTVENTGDIFYFSIKNHLNSVDLSLTDSGNSYVDVGQEIPKTVDDSDKALSQDQVKAAKKNYTVWSYVWMGIKAIVVFAVIAIVLFICGMILEAIFKSLNIVKIGIYIELIGILALSFYNGITMFSYILPIAFFIIYRMGEAKIKQIPEQYKNFSSIKDSISREYQLLFSVIFAVLFLMVPELADKLPAHINFLDRYLYVYLCLICGYVLFGLKDDLDYPEKIKEFVETKGVVTEDEIDDYVDETSGDDPSDETLAENREKMMRTLADLAKVGLIEKDDENKCFRSKK